ncbi:MAG: hypothetical protein ACI9XP_000932 [Lentimonas sp.]|jgi:hypothetical protein
MVKFKSKIDKFFKSLLIVCFALGFIMSLAVYLLEKEDNVLEAFLTVGLFLMLFVLFIILVKYTFYEVHDDQLVLKSAFVKRKMSYEEITKIIVGKKWYVGLKLSTANKGIVICYGDNLEVFISPEKEAEFIEALKQKNSLILIQQD